MNRRTINGYIFKMDTDLTNKTMDYMNWTFKIL